MEEVNTPLVSVIMNCYNSETYLREAIDSVYAQTYKNWEIIFWDNCSTDGSAKIANSYDSRLRYFRGEKNIPLGAARNLALEKVRGEFVTFLDCDDLILPQKLEKLVPLFFADSEIGFVYSDAILFNSKGDTKQVYAGRVFHRGHCFRKLLAKYNIAFLTVVIRKKAIDSLDYWFDDSFSMCEEADLFLRIAYKWKIDMVPDVLGKWRVHSESLTWKNPIGFSEEFEEMMVKYEKFIPDFKVVYQDEIKSMRMNHLIATAISFWRGHRPAEAREKLRSLLFCNLRATVYWFFMFLPFKSYSYVIKWVRSSNSISP